MAKQQFPWLNKEELFTEDVRGVRISYKKLSFGKQRKLQGEVTKVDDQGNVSIDASQMMITMAVEALVDWDFTDEGGVKLPIEAHTLDEVLDPEYSAEVVKVITDKISGDVKPKKKKK